MVDPRVRMLSHASAIAERKGASMADASIALSVLGDICTAIAAILERLDRIDAYASAVSGIRRHD